MNTSKIKTVFHLHWDTDNDFGTRIRFKCHQRIQRKAKTLESELCTNWKLMDSLGVRIRESNSSVYQRGGYTHFYDYPDLGEELLYNSCASNKLDT